MYLITPAELRRLRDIIEKHHLAFIVTTFGLEAAGITEEELQELVDKGILSPEAATGLLQDPIGDAYLTGIVLAKLRETAGTRPDRTGNQLSLDAIEEQLRKDPIPLSPYEKKAIESARNRAGEYCRGLGNKVDEELRTISIETDREQAERMRQEIANATEEAIAKRQTVGRLKREIGDRTGDWSRDLERIASTELQTARQQGAADYVEETFGKRAMVAKIPAPDACDKCKAAYLDPMTGHPRIFALEDLRANGSNAGKRQAEWQPIVDAHHPWCHCELVHIPDGFVFNEDGQLVPAGSRTEEPGE